MSQDFLGYLVRSDGPLGCVDDIVQAIERGERRWLACLNPHSYVESLRYPAFSAALRDADWLVPDGVGVVLGSRFLGGDIRERVTGYDVFHGVSSRLAELGGGRVFFLGSTQETLSLIRKRMTIDWPALEVVGTCSPPFKCAFSEDENAAIVDSINSSRPDVLWVGMTAPKQEQWIHTMLPRLNVRFAAAVGAVFDFYAGRIRRSHPAFQRMGLEWLPRLIQEPRRLWRRTFVSAPVFMWHVSMARVGRLRE